MQEIADFLTLFSSILWEALPFIVLGAVVAGILEEFLPQQWLTKFLPKQVLPAVMIGGVLGLLFPMCECGIVVVMRRLLRKGLPLSCCIAYMLAGPIINVVVLLSTYVAFSPHELEKPTNVLQEYGIEMVVLRAGIGFVVAVGVGLIVHYQHRKYGNALLMPMAMPKPEPIATEGDPSSTPPEKKTVMGRLQNISGTALHDFVDITVFLILGAVLAAIVKQQIGNAEINALSQEQPLLAVPGMMFMAFVMCLCSEADAFVAASFKGMNTSAKLAFLVFGPMLDIKLVLMYTRVFRLRLILTIVISVVVLVLTGCLLVHFLYPASTSVV